jgi:PadR family transcriptional regulator, regulatory protein PadR
MAPSMPLLKGTLDVLVLKALSWTAMHGFEITRWIEDGFGSALSLDDSALYQALQRLEERKLIVGEWGITENNRRARYYSLTTAGRAHLKAEAEALAKYARSLTTILETRRA